MTNTAVEDERTINEPRRLSIVCLAHRCDQSNIETAFRGDKSPTCKKCALKDLITLPFPFTDASLVSYDLVLIPSRGSFLADFNNTVGLHIGIIGEAGKILEFDHRGIRFSNPGDKKWTCCLRLNFIRSLLGENMEDRAFVLNAWRQTFVEISNPTQSNNLTRDYNLDQNNCFDFVLKFLSFWMQLLGVGYPLDENVSVSLRDKVEFCKSFVLPETRKMARYISVYRKLRGESKHSVVS